jgi:isoamyl acetate esterase
VFSAHHISITQGAHSTLVPHLAALYSRRADIINRGFSGYNTLHAVPLLPLLFPPSLSPSPSPSPRIALLTIFFGANDAVLPSNAQHVPLEQYKVHLRSLAIYPALKAHGTRVLFLTPPPVDEWQFTESPLIRTAEHTKLYADACRGVAAELGIVVVDVWRAFMQRAGWREDGPKGGKLVGDREIERSDVLGRLLSDGLHLTDEGYTVVSEELVRVIREEAEDVSPEALGMVVPDWKEVMGVVD